MQIQSYQTVQAIPSSQNVQNSSASVHTPKAEQGLQVSLSSQAKQLSQSETDTGRSAQIQPVPLPSEPTSPLSGEQLAKAVQIKKAQLHYQVASDMTNIVTGNNKGISGATAYYLSQNEDARESTLNAKSQQQSIDNMQAYQEQTQSLSEQYN
ncbi:hypothetical protein CW745_01580 [Psychromonas sp. psych-6C06]|uniref:hypothetical protein n=1 Tax=Psychromonas sp. psych-6C06 TaxID=2058089 RepID=UPI000C31CDC1|nr:hypothetical protein [Psychromonas sp. psych-6C06]PKF63563.1 hypothetical protein CW745_01580 [Psychromonas sp. psych-6C06]